MSVFGFSSSSWRSKGLLALVAVATQLTLLLSPFSATPAHAAVVNVSSSSLDFSSSKRTFSSSSPTPSQVGGWALYTNVATINGIQIDAKVTTVAISSGASISNYDAIGSASSNDSFFQIDNNVAAGGKTSFKFEFFDHADSTPVILQNVAVTAIDLDSPGRQFAEFSSFQSYHFSTTTSSNSTASKMSAYTTDANGAALGGGLVRFIQTRTNSAVSSNNDPWAAVEVDFAQMSSFQLSFGNEGASTGYFGIAFNTLCNTATNGGSAACAAGPGVNNPNNTPPTSNDTSLNYLNDGTTWTTLTSANFPYADADSNPFVQLKVTSLPTSGTLQQFVNGSWVNVALNDVIPASSVSSGQVRFRGTVNDSLSYMVYDGQDYATTASTLTLIASLQAQTITFNQPSNQTPNFANLASGATASSGLTVVLTSQTPSICTVSGLSIVAVASATGTCTVTASQPGSASAPYTYAAATPVTQSFQVTSLTAQSINLVAPANQTWNGSNGTASATVTLPSSGLAVSVISLTVSVCTVSYTAQFTTATVTYLSTGVCQLRATQAGNSTYAAATPVVASFTISSASVQSSYTVTFDPGAASGSTYTQSASTATALTSNTFTYQGYTFAGWSTTSGGSVVYANGASYPFTSSQTLYAIWTQSGSAPALPAAPTITVPGATTTGTTPVVFTPAINAPGGIGSACLVDPADQVCKQTVTLPGKGTFVRNANGTVTFTAVLGWVGTATVQYRVTDPNGQVAEAPVTVTVVAPAAPTVTGGTGTTITTVPANVTPLTTGQGSICLIDPADSQCKATVTIPGKGTFVLNANGTVTFTAVSGFLGTVTVQLQITSAYGQVAQGPVTFIVGPTSQLQTGTTTGTIPVALAPSTKPEPGSACLVDPNDQGCKNVVTIPQVGTWNLNPSTGGVTFQAVTGYVGTTVVQYRVQRAGFNPTFTPFVVTVGKKRPPVTVTIGGFNPGSPILTTAIKNQIAAFMKAYVGYKTVECIGFTMGPTVLKIDKWLSTARATNACDYILKTLKSKVTALPLKNKMETDLGSNIRRITLTLRD